MFKEVKLYSEANLSSLKWPKSYAGSLVKEYFAKMMEEDSTRFVLNGASQLFLLRIGDNILPVTVNETEYSNSYVTSMYSFLSYAKEEMKRNSNRAINLFMTPIINGVSFWFKRSSINKIVSVNNYLLSTNIYCSLSQQDIEQIHFFLLKRFPHHSILFRSLNKKTEGMNMGKLQELSYHLLTSRSIYFFDPMRKLDQKQRWNIGQDLNLFNQEGISEVSHEEFKLEDVPRIKQLYDQLYLEKYSYYNPQFSERFFEEALKSKGVILHGIKYQKKLVAVVGYFKIGGVMTTPIVGYDASLPQSQGLYRMTIAHGIKVAKEEQCLFHLSSGVGHFKRKRGALQEIESMAIYVKHLPLRRRMPWNFFKIILNKISKRVLIKYKL
ncbi:MAG: GNAT family N-acetyltransferase [Rhabdochlamydiaceae bacterium]|nr:GNAT family N-acetyltransferase [Candidatus Amphrikana amoebophyrae]